ncbi:MAG TPA: hypothetical protein VFI65_06275 [Streptosporangiaceae bacterium]|nr:hypothetical protein [Streptosporangiaceae bacterium]
MTDVVVVGAGLAGLAADLIEAMVDITTQTMAIDPAQPWAHPQATELDSMTFESWISAQPYCDGAKESLRLLSDGGLGLRCAGDDDLLRGRVRGLAAA